MNANGLAAKLSAGCLPLNLIGRTELSATTKMSTRNETQPLG